MVLWFKKTVVLSCAVALLVGTSVSQGWSYPLDQVTKPRAECKSVNWSTLNDDCKMNLPIIAQANYANYAKDWNTQVIYSDIWGGSYNDGWDLNNGGAPSTDIATAEGTPVTAIWEGKVIFAGELAGYGNSVTVEHDLWNGKKIWSSYSHLSKILIQKGDTVKEKQLIGEVGKSGFTIWPFGYHLDFAITTTKQKNYPYAYSDCKSGYMSAVQNGVCRDLLAKNTIDPILFIELNWNLDKSMEIARAAVAKKEAIIWSALLASTNSTKPSEPTKEVKEINKDLTTKQDIPVEVKQNPQPLIYVATAQKNADRIINQKIFEIDESPYVIKIVDLQRDEKESIAYEGKAYITIAVSKDGKPYEGYLNKELSFVSKNKIVWIGGGLIDYVEWGEKTVILYGDKVGDDVITVKLGNETIGIHQTSVKS